MVSIHYQLQVLSCRPPAVLFMYTVYFQGKVLSDWDNYHNSSNEDIYMLQSAVNRSKQLDMAVPINGRTNSQDS